MPVKEKSQAMRCQANLPLPGWVGGVKKKLCGSDPVDRVEMQCGGASAKHAYSSSFQKTPSTKNTNSRLKFPAKANCETS